MSFGSRHSDSANCPYRRSPLLLRRRKLQLYHTLFFWGSSRKSRFGGLRIFFFRTIFGLKEPRRSENVLTKKSPPPPSYLGSDHRHTTLYPTSAWVVQERTHRKNSMATAAVGGEGRHLFSAGFGPLALVTSVPASQGVFFFFWRSAANYSTAAVSHRKKKGKGLKSVKRTRESLAHVRPPIH